MKRIYFIVFTTLWLVGCDPASDCLQTSGETTTLDLVVEPFSALEINADVTVILKEGRQQQVRLSTGKNLVKGITYEVTDGRLIINNENSCNWIRSYNMPVLTIEHPDLHEITQGGSGLIRSSGPLHYTSLVLLSRYQSGDFNLELACEKLTISGNDLTNFYLSGYSDILKIGFYSGDGRFEGGDFKVKKAEIYHRGSNDMIIFATEQLTGRILSTGNLLYVKTPPAVVDVSEENIGKLINRTN